MICVEVSQFSWDINESSVLILVPNRANAHDAQIS